MDKTNLPTAGRLEVFSDGVFAIIMTLMILGVAFILRPLALLLLFLLPLIYVVPTFFTLSGKDH